MKRLFFIASFLFMAKGVCVLPPLYHSSNEIISLLQDTQLVQMLGSGQCIEQIKKVSKGYMITTQKYHLLVEITYTPLLSKMVGPAKFSFYFRQPILRDDTSRQKLD